MYNMNIKRRHFFVLFVLGKKIFGILMTVN